MKYTHLLFDLDNTLMDFDKSERVAFFETMGRLSIEADEAVFSSYKQINSALWKRLEQGTIDKNIIEKIRFNKFFEHCNIEQPTQDAGEIYHECLAKYSFVIDGAEQLLQNLSSHAKIVIVTNGIKSIQTPRLANSGLNKYFSNIFISEEIGFNKPDKRFFDVVFDEIGKEHKKSSIVIGDSLSSDMKGAHNSGLDSCFYNPKKIENSEKVPVTFEIDKLEQLYKVLGLEI